MLNKPSNKLTLNRIDEIFELDSDDIKDNSLNLSNSVAIITYEILRQHNFEDLQGTSTYFDK